MSGNIKAAKLKLGICPIGKFVFSHEDALVYKDKISKYLDKENINYVNIDTVITDGMVRDQSHVEPIVDYFKQQGIDALFIPHCNFGTEGAAGMIAKKCGVPVLLWGPRDGAPLEDGSRLRDSLCGTLATSKVLNTLKVPFSYIPNCHITDKEFSTGLDKFIRAANIVKTIKNMRIGFLGQRVDFFWSTIINEAALLEKFGIEVLPLDLTNAISDIKKLVKANKKEYENQQASFEKWISFNGFKNRDSILYNYAMRDWLLAKAQEFDIDAFAIQSFTSIHNELGMAPALGYSLVNDKGIPTAPESDIHGAISSALIEAGSGSDEPSFLPDVTIRHPENDNGVLLWHVDAPLSLRNKNSSVKIDIPWILKDLPTGHVHMHLKDGPLTLCRFDGDSEGNYRLGAGEGHTIDGPYTQEFYTWMEVDNWPVWEQQLVRGPYIHHSSCIYGHCADVLQEATRFINGLEFEKFGKR